MTERRENLERRPLVIGLLGCLASGKTTLASELGNRWNLKPIEENYPANPYLENFYENPPEYSFRSQTFFLISKIEQLQTLDRSKASLIDPALDMDFIYAKTHFKMGWMNENEWNLYQNLFNTLSSRDGLVYPDMHIVVTADSDDLKQRIVERGRKYELWILNNYPEYLDKLTKSVDEWVKNERNHSYKFLANTSYASQSNTVEGLANRIETHICKEFGTSGKFVLPKIQPTPVTYYHDIFPGSGESARLRR